MFLRVWKDHRQTDGDGEKVQVYWKNRTTQSNGDNERLEHLTAIEHGVQGIAIECEAVNSNSIEKRTIKSFDQENLLLLGSLSEDDDFAYARIVGSIKKRELQAAGLALQASGLAEDLKPIVTSQADDPTTVQALVDARVGQRQIARAVLKLWKNRCCVTGSSTVAAICASHIKPWRESTDADASTRTTAFL